MSRCEGCSHSDEFKFVHIKEASSQLWTFTSALTSHYILSHENAFDNKNSARDFGCAYVCLSPLRLSGCFRLLAERNLKATGFFLGILLFAKLVGCSGLVYRRANEAVLHWTCKYSVASFLSATTFLDSKERRKSMTKEKSWKSKMKIFMNT